MFAKQGQDQVHKTVNVEIIRKYGDEKNNRHGHFADSLTERQKHTYRQVEEQTESQREREIIRPKTIRHVICLHIFICDHVGSSITHLWHIYGGCRRYRMHT